MNHFANTVEDQTGNQPAGEELATTENVPMKPYLLQLEISGPIALWARPDTLPNPVSYVAPTFSAVKGIFEAILRWKSVKTKLNL